MFLTFILRYLGGREGWTAKRRLANPADARPSLYKKKAPKSALAALVRGGARAASGASGSPKASEEADNATASEDEASAKGTPGGADAGGKTRGRKLRFVDVYLAPNK